MRVHLLIRLVAGISLLAATSLAQDQAADMSAQNAVVHRPAAGQSLTSPSQAAPGQIIADFLRANGHSNQTASSLVTTGVSPTTSGVTHIRLEQQVGGLTIYGAYVKAALNSQGELVYLIEMLAPVGALGRASINEGDALNIVIGQLYPSARPGLGLGRGTRNANSTSFSQNGFFHQDPTVTRVIVPFANGRLREGFLVETWTQDSNLLQHTLVSGNGQIVSSELRTNQDSYNIFPDHPLNSSQTVTAGPGAGNAQSPSGWLSGSQSTFRIQGNNANAYLDSDANNSPDSGGTTVTSGNFSATANLAQAPTTSANKAVAVQNLFYLNNKIHDKLYQHGFNEAAGNFQETNFISGGFGSDSVNAEAQDGSGTNNANFSTPSDGSNPRMQMYIWTVTSPNRDGDVDSDIVYHEYGHGLTWRMIGGMSGAMSGAIGEGMSDVVAILMNDNDVVGEYSYNRATGIRRYAYTDYPLTYGDFSGSSIHNDGEIYAATIWKLWQIYDDATNGIPQDTLFDDLVGGMNFTPSGPAMQDMRDGILAQTPSSRDCLVWEAFAAMGIGEGASSSTKAGGPFGGGSVSVNESFTVPSSCSGTPAAIQITTTSLNHATEGVSSSQQIATSGGSGTKTWSLSAEPAWLTIDQNGLLTATSPLAGTFNFSVNVSDTTGSDSQALALVVDPAVPGGAPAAPANLTLTAKRPFVMVSWTDASNNEDGFYINRCTGSLGSCTPALLATVPSGTTSYKDSSAATGQTYTYSVAAFRGSFTSSTPPQSITK